MELHLTPDIEQALVEQARGQGTTPEQLALEGLRQQFVHHAHKENPPTAPDTLADFLAEFIGVLHSSDYVPGGARLSESTSKSFTRALVEKRRRGRL